MPSFDPPDVDPNGRTAWPDQLDVASQDAPTREFASDHQRPWRPDLLDCEGGAHPFLIMRLILIGVVDVADQGVIARLEV